MWAASGNSGRSWQRTPSLEGFSRPERQQSVRFILHQTMPRGSSTVSVYASRHDRSPWTPTPLETAFKLLAASTHCSTQGSQAYHRMTAVLQVRGEQLSQPSSARVPSEVSVQTTSLIDAQASAFSVTAVERKASSSSSFVNIVQHEYQQLYEPAEDERRQNTDLQHTQLTQSCHGLKHHRLTTALPGSRCALQHSGLTASASPQQDQRRPAIFSQAARSTSQVGFDLECLHSSPTPRRLDSNGSLTASRVGSQLPARDYPDTWICIAGSAKKPAATATARSQSSTAINALHETQSFHDPTESSCFHSEEAGSFSRMSNSIDAQSKRNPPDTAYSQFSLESPILRLDESWEMRNATQPLPKGTPNAKYKCTAPAVLQNYLRQRTFRRRSKVPPGASSRTHLRHHCSKSARAEKDHIRSTALSTALQPCNNKGRIRNIVLPLPQKQPTQTGMVQHWPESFCFVIIKPTGFSSAHCRTGGSADSSSASMGAVREPRMSSRNKPRTRSMVQPAARQGEEENHEDIKYL
ncbi:Hypothetical predicted protein [Olea europaea subsp. europaea]|uniref:Uncharacterized protein n=1 Tax=Olea europaea subsp. europaea TaxID=158383 RepID=A0A8S0VNM9_OLEEU|nr:Hypothetical predicted protein [Olea europaea subsp. europaea]